MKTTFFVKTVMSLVPLDPTHPAIVILEPGSLSSVPSKLHFLNFCLVALDNLKLVHFVDEHEFRSIS